MKIEQLFFFCFQHKFPEPNQLNTTQHPTAPTQLRHVPMNIIPQNQERPTMWTFLQNAFGCGRPQVPTEDGEEVIPIVPPGFPLPETDSQVPNQHFNIITNSDPCFIKNVILVSI